MLFVPLGVKFSLGGLIFLILGGAWVGTHKEWRKEEEEQLIFRQPFASRFLLSGCGLWLMLLPLLLAGNRPDKITLFLFLFIELLSFLIGILLFCIACLRRELILNIPQRAYRFTCGWGRHPAVYSGSFNDFGGVFVRSPSGRSKSEQYSAGLIWKSGGLTTPLLGMSGKQQEMAALAEEMVSVLGVTVVPAPAPETYWEMLRRKPTS